MTRRSLWASFQYTVGPQGGRGAGSLAWSRDPWASDLSQTFDVTSQGLCGPALLRLGRFVSNEWCTNAPFESSKIVCYLSYFIFFCWIKKLLLALGGSECVKQSQMLWRWSGWPELVLKRQIVYFWRFVALFLAWIVLIGTFFEGLLCFFGEAVFSNWCFFGKTLPVFAPAHLVTLVLMVTGEAQGWACLR